MRSATVMLAFSLALAQSTWAQEGQAPKNTLATPQPTAAGVSGGSVAELQKLISAQALQELRTAYNGSYGASLLFHGESLTYFATLFKGKDFWRVLKTENATEAERVYRTFAAQSEQLAETDISAIRLAAEKSYTARLIAQNEGRLQALRAELDREQQQASQVAAARRDSSKTAASLNSELDSASERLRSLQESIRQLEAQQSSTELNLPAAPVSQKPRN